MAPKEKHSDPLIALKGSVRQCVEPFTPVLDVDEAADSASMACLAEIVDDRRLSDGEVVALMGSALQPLRSSSASAFIA